MYTYIVIEVQPLNGVVWLRSIWKVPPALLHVSVYEWWARVNALPNVGDRVVVQYAEKGSTILGLEL